MKFSTGLSPGILARFAVLLIAVFSLLSIGCESISSRTARSTSLQQKTLQTASLASWERPLPKDGPQPVLVQRSVRRPERSTSFIGYATPASLATRALSDSNSAGPISSRSNSSASLTIFTSRSSRTIPIATYANSLSTDFSRTERYYSTPGRPRSTTLGKLPATSLRISPTSRSGPLSRLRQPGSGLGDTSLASTRRRSNTPGSWPRSITARASSVSRSTASLSGSASPPRRSSDSTGSSQRSLPGSSTVPT